jgi:hypothetical protein
MTGPTDFADYIYLHLGDKGDELIFRPGRYRVISAFVDRDGYEHQPGEQWLLVFVGFSRFEDEKVLYVSLDEKHQWIIPLWWDAEGQQEIIENFSRFAEWIGPLPSGFPPPKRS